MKCFVWATLLADLICLSLTITVNQPKVTTEKTWDIGIAEHNSTSQQPVDENVSTKWSYQLSLDGRLTVEERGWVLLSGVQRDLPHETFIMLFLFLNQFYSHWFF